jgi:signal transduction histidine kinase/CheY-like chemotaxis protein
VDRLQELNSSLETTVAERTHELNEAHRQALQDHAIHDRLQAQADRERVQNRLHQSQRLESLGQLAGGIAHDFNNLLVVILSCSRFLLEELPEDDPRRSDIEDIKEAGDRAANLVRQLLAFGRRSPQLNIVVDLNEVVGGVEKLLRRTIGEHISMTVSLAPDPWPTTIDPTHFEQVLLNLALNARDAMPTGGELRVSTSNSMLEHPPANCEGLAPGRYALLTIEDTGSGMTPEILSKMFEPFFTTKEKGKGTGLGLSTVYGIVEEAHGTIAVTSVPGQGTTFTIYLPACDEAQVLSPPLPDVSRKRGQGEKILLVEDEDKVRGIVRRILEDSGFCVIAARSAAEALRHLQDGGAADLVLSDIVMPQVSGTELATSIRALRPGLPVVLMSGYSEWQRMSPEYGPVLQKPFTAEGLVARLQEALTASAAA